jgi:hypothetical protein
MPCIAKCPYCGQTIEAADYETAKKLYRQHLLDRHDDILSERLETLCRERSCPFDDDEKNKSWLAGFLAALIVQCDNA